MGLFWQYSFKNFRFQNLTSKGFFRPKLLIQYLHSIHITFLMSSKVWISGDNPPWTHRNCWFISAARGRQSNASIQASYTDSVYLILPTNTNKCNMLTGKGCPELNIIERLKITSLFFTQFHTILKMLV